MTSTIGPTSLLKMLNRWTILRPCYTLSSRSNLCSVASQSSGTVDPPPPDNATQAAASDKDLQVEIQQLTTQLQEADDKYKRSLAERENVRIRLEKQVQDGKRFGIQSFCKDLLDVADILGKATESVPPEEITDKNPHLKSLYEGLKMTEAQLFTVFQRHGVSLMDPLGAKFDPHQHEALFEQVVEGRAPGLVCVVTKAGYTLHQRTIRPALVGVTKAPPPPPPAQAQ